MIVCESGGSASRCRSHLRDSLLTCFRSVLYFPSEAALSMTSPSRDQLKVTAGAPRARQVTCAVSPSRAAALANRALFTIRAGSDENGAN